MFVSVFAFVRRSPKGARRGDSEARCEGRGGVRWGEARAVWGVRGEGCEARGKGVGGRLGKSLVPRVILDIYPILISVSHYRFVSAGRYPPPSSLPYPYPSEPSKLRLSYPYPYLPPALSPCLPLPCIVSPSATGDRGEWRE